MGHSKTWAWGDPCLQGIISGGAGAGDSVFQAKGISRKIPLAQDSSILTLSVKLLALQPSRGIVVIGTVTRHTTALPPPPAAHRVSARAMASACPCSQRPSRHSLCQGKLETVTVTPQRRGTHALSQNQRIWWEEALPGGQPRFLSQCISPPEPGFGLPEAGTDQAMHGNYFHVSHEAQQLTYPGEYILSLL